MQLFKVLGADGTAYHGGTGKWYLPKGKRPGKWMPKIEGRLVPCSNGYHLCRKGDLAAWLGPAIYEAEYSGGIVESADKVVVRSARLLRRLPWDERVARLFACSCARHVLPIYEKRYPDDKRPRNAVNVARRFANGRATKDELATAWDAAWAARDAAGDAAGDAAWAARATAGDAAGATAGAARDAAGAAAWATAGDAWATAGAARDAEQKWQTRRLMRYLGISK